jgi:hypothetical protein
MDNFMIISLIKLYLTIFSQFDTSFAAFNQVQMMHPGSLPSPVAQLSISYTNNAANISWINGGSAAAGYLIVRGADNTPPAFVPVNGTTYTVGSNGADYIVFTGISTSFTDNYVGNRIMSSYYHVYAFDSDKNYSARTQASVGLARPALDNISNQAIARFQTMTPIDVNDQGDDLDNKSAAISYQCYFDNAVDNSVIESVASICSSVNLPGSVVFNQTTGTLSGYTPDTFVSREFKIRGCDSLNNCDTKYFKIDLSTTCAGTIYRGYCMYCGTPSQSCTTVCSTHGGWDSVPTKDLFGSGGTNADCTTAINTVCNVSYTFNSTASVAHGCFVDASSKKSPAIKRGTATTTADAATTDYHRLCGCNS